MEDIKKDDIIESYIIWFYRRNKYCPSVDQIEEFGKCGIYMIQYHLKRDRTMPEAFRLWEYEINS